MPFHAFTRRRVLVVAMSLWAIGLLAVAPVRAQGTNATVLGTVTDESGGVLPAVTVTATNTDTGFTRETVTAGTGTYRLSGLPPGNYTVKVNLTGFVEQSRPNVKLILLQEQTLDFKLTVAALQESVTVTGGVPLVEVTKSEVSGAVLQVQIMNLPVASRQFTDLALLLPGANADQRREWSDPVNIGSGSWHQTAFVMDGANNNWAATGESRMNFTQEAVQEFKVITSGFKAEYGNSATGVVIGVSKSGTNNFHGSAFEFFRNKALRSKAPFETEKPDTNKNEYGGTFGGPIVQNRAHFFAAIEQLNEKTFINVSSGGVYPSLDGLAPEPIDQTLGTFKVDATLSPKHSMFVRYALQRKTWDNQGVGGSIHASASQNLTFPRDSVVTGLTSVFSNVVNELRVEYASTRATKIPVTPTGLGFSFPSITYGSSFIFEHEDEDRTEIVDDVVIHKTGWKGSHDFKFGGSASPYIPTSAKWWWCPDGCYTFSADVPGFPAVQPNFDQLSAAGQIQQLFIGLIPNAPVINYPVYGWYVQDDWTPMSKLTLNLGMRWDAQWNSMLHELDGEPFIGTLKLPGYDRTTRKRDLNNFAPRFGFAYELNEQTVLRGSAGIYYSMLPNLPLYIEPRDRDGIDTNSVVISNPHLTNWTDPLAEIGDPKQYHDARPSISVNANDMVNPDSRQYGLGITRQLTATLSLKADVVKVDGKHELRNRNLNALGMPNGVRQTDEFGVITEQVTTGHSDYKALLMSLEKRMSDKYQFMLSYTLASAKNTLGSMWEGIGDTNRPEDEYGAAIADRRQRFVFSGITTAIPWGIQVSGVLSLGSPRPFDVRAGVDLNLDGDFNDRPPGVTRDQGCRDLSLDAINAFRAANGVAPVSGVECPNAADLDVRVSKPIRFGGSKSLELMFEVFNLTGADNLNHPDSQGVTQHQALSNVFGKAIIAGPPRQAQLAVRFSF